MYHYATAHHTNSEHSAPTQVRLKNDTKAKVLIVDSDLERSKNTTHQLASRFTVITASNTAKALAKLRKYEVAVLLLNLNIADHAFWSEIQKYSKNTQCLIYGDTDPTTISNFEQNNQIFAYLPNPWEPQALTMNLAKAYDQYQLQKKLNDEYTLLETLMNNIPDCIYFKDTQSNFIRVNKASTKIMGIEKPEDAIGKKQSDFFAPEVVAKIDRDDQRLLETGKSITDQITQIGPTEKKRWVSVTKVPMRDQGNNITGIMGISRDITNRKKLEDQLKFLYETTSETAKACTYQIALKNVIRRVCTTTNCDYGEVWLPTSNNQKLHFSNITYHTQDLFEELVPQSQNLYFSPGEGLPGKIFQTKQPQILDGLNDPAHFTRSHLAQKLGLKMGFGIPILDGDEVLAVMVFFSQTTPSNIHDICHLTTTIANQLGSLMQRKKMESALYESEKRLEYLINHLPDGVCLFDSNHQILKLNATAKDHLQELGITNLKKSLTHLADTDIETLLTSRSDGAPHEITSKSNDPHLFEVSAKPIAITEETEASYALLIRDVTEDRIKQSRIQTQYRLASLGQLAAGIAHDFNNILTVMIGTAQLLTYNNKINDEAGEELRLIYNQGQRAAQMVRQVLDFSRQTDAVREPIDVIPFIKEAIQLLTRTVSDEITVNTHFHTSECVIEANLTQIQQVLNNIVINAQQAMQNGGTLTIDVNASHIQDNVLPFQNKLTCDQWLTIAITDTGCGISSPAIDHIFEPFFTTKSATDGTGLGLAQSYGIIQNHNGHIAVETQEKKGSTFTIYLPVYAGSDTEALPVATPPPKGNGETILLVEDQEDTRKITQKILHTLNYKTILAKNGQEALELFDTNHHVDLLLTDFSMPHMNGLELAQKIRTQAPQLPIIVTSGYVNQAQWENYPSVFDKYIDKPLELTEVAKTLAECLQNAVPKA